MTIKLLSKDKKESNHSTNWGQPDIAQKEPSKEINDKEASIKKEKSQDSNFSKITPLQPEQKVKPNSNSFNVQLQPDAVTPKMNSLISTADSRIKEKKEVKDNLINKQQPTDNHTRDLSIPRFGENTLQTKQESSNIKPEEKEMGNIQMNSFKTGGQNVPQVSSKLASQLNSTKGLGSPLPKGVSHEMGQKIGGNFSNVRVHTDDNAVQMSKEIGAKAFTHGNDIYFNNGKYNPESSSGKHLLAHELTHVVQQKNNLQRKIMRAVTEQSVEAEFIKWADENKRVKDKTHEDFPWSVWDFIRPKIVDEVMDPLPKPKDPKGLKEWQDNYSRAEIIVKWLFTLKANSTNDDIKKEADSKAYNILDSLAKAGFVSQAVAQSVALNPDTRTIVYNTILQNPSTTSASELETIVTFLCATADVPTKVTIVNTLTNKQNSPLKSLDDSRTKAIIKPLVFKFGIQQKIIDAIAEILMFNPKVRTSISDSMMSSQIGNPDLLFKVLKHNFFIEPMYGTTILPALKPKGMSNEDYDKSRMKTDMPWVYTYKQKYYIQYLIDLAKSQAVIIPPPTKMDFLGLKTWLNENTEKIGEATKKKYPTKPDAIFEIYKNITDIFFFHVDKGNITPNPEGKIGHLTEGEPAKKRIKSDCDVFATYAMRFFFNAGFEPIGYIALVPSNDAAHAAALVRKEKTYYVISNKEVLETGVSETKIDEKKLDALKRLSNLAFYNVYNDANLINLKIYYADAEGKGKMPQSFMNLDNNILRTDLNPYQ
jgi:hypothetical protein